MPEQPARQIVPLAPAPEQPLLAGLAHQLVLALRGQRTPFVPAQLARLPRA